MWPRLAKSEYLKSEKKIHHNYFQRNISYRRIPNCYTSMLLLITMSVQI